MANDASTFHLYIVSPEKMIFEGDASSVSLPGSGGRFTILPHHAPIVSTLQAGTIRYESGGREQTIETKSGFVEMSDGQVSVCIS